MKNMDTGRTIGEIVLSTPLFLTGWDSTLFDLKNFGFNFPDPEATRDFVADLSAWFSQNMTNNLLEDPPTYRISIDALVDVKVIHIPISKVNFRTEQRLEFASLFANIGKKKKAM